MANDKVFLLVYVVTDLKVDFEDKIIGMPAGIDPRWNVRALFNHLQSVQPPVVHWIKSISNKCTFYSVNDPVQMDHIEDITRSSLKDETKYKKILNATPLKNIAKKFQGDYLYLVIADVADGSELADQKLQERSLVEFYTYLTIHVQTPYNWTKEDVQSNDGVFLDDYDGTIPPEISELEARLQKKRFYSTGDDDRNLASARSFAQFNTTYAHISEDAEGSGGETVDPPNSLEFLAFYNMLCCYIPDAPRYSADNSSSLKATALKSNFLLPPFFSGQPSNRLMVYHEEASWKFPMFVKCDAMALLPRRYTPKNDFCVWLQKLNIPFLLGEVVSEQNEKDRYRMLLQGIALTRLVFAVRKPGSKPFVVAVYLTRNLVAEVHIMLKTESEPEKIFISHKKFNLADDDGAIDFQRFMFNLASAFKSILQDALNPDMAGKVRDIATAANGMKSLHSKGAWTEQNQARSKGRTMNSISEEPDLDAAEDDLGVFDEENIRDALLRMNYQVAYVAYGYSHLAPVMNLANGQIVGCLKFVKDGGAEISILQRLAGLHSKFNHTVQPFGIWPVTGGSIIGMPAAGNPLTSVANPDTHLLSLTTQLFEAVDFMHENCIAHLDLKPSNILVSLDGSCLTVVDFGLSVSLKNPGQKLTSRGQVGTKGYIAPEVGYGKFSPICADLWSVGKVVEEFCLLCRPSPCRDYLLALSKQLLNNDPSKRPTMSEVLCLDVVKPQQIVSSSLTFISPRPAAVLV